MKRIITLILVVLMLVSMAILSGCTSNDDKYVIGIIQTDTSDDIDAATKGFKDAVVEVLGKRNVEFVERNAEGDVDICTTIASDFVSMNVDLILANSTPALKSVATATSEIPILGTSVAEYGVALEIDGFEGIVGTNVSGTSNLPPLTDQAKMIIDLVSDAKKVGLLYCSAEPDSFYQVEEVSKYLRDKGVEVKEFSFSSSLDAAMISKIAASYSDAIYIPTDNTALSCVEIIKKAVLSKKVPVVTGEAGICRGCGIATLSINCEEMGRKTGEMAVRILKDGEDISKMAIEYVDDPVKQYNADICKKLDITLPEGYEELPKK